MKDSVGQIVCKRPVAIIVLVLVITALLGSQLANISFGTDMDKFLPESDVAKAKGRVTEYFGKDAEVHMIYVEEKSAGEGVLTPDALREQYRIIQNVTAMDGVEQTVSVADVVDLLVKLEIGFGTTDYNPNRTLLNVYDSTIQKRVDNILMELLRNGTNATQDLQAMDISNSTVDQIELLINFLFSKDFDPETDTSPKATIIVVQLNGSLSGVQLKALAGKIRNVVEEIPVTEIKIQHTSQHLLSFDIDLNSSDTNRLLVGSIFGLMIIILALSFRRGSYVVLPILTLVITTIWTLGAMYAMGLNFTAVTVAVIPVIIGLGVDYAVHISRRYQEELAKGKDYMEAITISIAQVGSAIFLAVVTTVIAFLSNLSSDVGPIRDFGISVALGITFAFVLTMTFYPATRFLMDNGAAKRKAARVGSSPQVSSTASGLTFVADDHCDESLQETSAVASAPVGVLAADSKHYEKKTFFDALSRANSRFVRKQGALISIVVILVSVVAVYGAVNLPSKFNLEDFLPQDWESVSSLDDIRANLDAGSFTTSYILIEDDNLATLEFLNALEATLDGMQDDPYMVKITVGSEKKVWSESLLDVISVISERNATVASSFHLTPEGEPGPGMTDADVDALFDYLYESEEPFASLGGDIAENVSLPGMDQTIGERTRLLLHRDDASNNFDAAVVRFYENSIEAGDTRALTAAVEADLEAAGFAQTTAAKVTGSKILTITTADAFQDNMVLSTTIAVILAAIILIAIYRSFILGILPTIPVVISSLWILGTMYYIGYELNILTVMTTALTIGLGIDYSIHVLERFKEEREKGASPDEAIDLMLVHTGAALWISAITTIAGFGILIISPMPVIQKFGIITSITIAYSILLAVVVLPVILLKRERAIERKKNNL